MRTLLRGTRHGHVDLQILRKTPGLQIQHWYHLSGVILLLCLHVGCKKDNTNEKPPAKNPTHEAKVEKKAPPPPKQTTYFLVTMEPVWYLASDSRFRSLGLWNRKTSVEESLVKHEGKVIGLDLKGVSPDKAAELIAKHPDAARSIAVEIQTLCSPKVLKGINGQQGDPLSLSFYDRGFTDDKAACLQKLTGRELHLWVPYSLTDKGMVHFSKLQKLRSFSFHNLEGSKLYMKRRVTDEGILQLANLSRIQRLGLSYTRVTQKSLDGLKKLIDMEHLEIGPASIRDDVLPLLDHYKGLKRLKIHMATRVTDNGMKHLNKFSQLEHLDLGITGVRGPGLRHLTDLKRIRYISLGMMSMDSGMSHLSKMTSLETVVLGNSFVSDAGMVHLASLKKLRNLSIESSRVSDVGVAHVAKLKELREIHLWKAKVTDKGLQLLGQLPNLRRIVLYETKVSCAGMKKLAEGRPKLDTNVDGICKKKK